jgi:hypothetical protein
VIALDGDSTRIGDVTVVVGAGCMALIVDGRWPGLAALTPDHADVLAEELVRKARYARELDEEETP